MTHCDFEKVLTLQLNLLYGKLNEKDRRILIGCTALLIGRGGAVFVRNATGAAKNTVTKSIKEMEDALDPILDSLSPDELNLCLDDASLEDDSGFHPDKLGQPLDDDVLVFHKSPKQQEKQEKSETVSKQETEDLRLRKLRTCKGKSEEERIRKPGGGRKLCIYKYPDLPDRIENIILNSGKSYGNPEKELKYTTLSLREIARILREDETNPIDVSRNIISRMLNYLGYSKQQNQKMLQVGEPHPDRNEQFEFINQKGIEFLASGDPVISIDTKKKEKLGNFKNEGAEYRTKGKPRQVLDHDFELSALGHIIPYGIYLVNDNTGFVNLGIDHDTPEFACASLKVWLKHIGLTTFPLAKRLYITCDGGGSNGSRLWLWKVALQEIADETNLEIHVSHYPPGTSKWNKIEHRLFCHISRNWAGQPLEDIETAISLIGSTKTNQGLTVQCVLDPAKYPTGKKVTQEQKDNLNIEFIPVCNTSAWNYIIRPRNNGLV